MTRYLTEPEGIKLLDAHGLKYPPHILLHDANEIVRIKEMLGYPVVMKVVSGKIVHKSDSGCVRVNVGNEAEAFRAYQEIVHSAANQCAPEDISGVLVCEQVVEAQEVILGMVRDEIFGPCLMFGLGGIFVEVLKDVSFRICPVDQHEARMMISEIRGYKIVQGIRGKHGINEDCLVDAILKLSALVRSNPDISQVDLNPVRIVGDEAMVLDVRVGIDEYGSGR